MARNSCGFFATAAVAFGYGEPGISQVTWSSIAATKKWNHELTLMDTNYLV